MSRLSAAHCLLKTVDVEYRRSVQGLSAHQLWDLGLSARRVQGQVHSQRSHLALWQHWLRLLKKSTKRR